MCDEVGQAARDELRARLRAQPGVGRGAVARLRTRLERLAGLFAWGDLRQDQYREKRSETEAEIAAIVSDMPDDKLVAVSTLPAPLGSCRRFLLESACESAHDVHRDVGRPEEGEHDQGHSDVCRSWSREPRLAFMAFPTHDQQERHDRDPEGDR